LAVEFHSFNLFLDPDYRRFPTLARGEWSISGFRARDLRQYIDALTPGRASYLIKRLRTHGLIKKVAHSYKYLLLHQARAARRRHRAGHSRVLRAAKSRQRCAVSFLSLCRRI